MKYLPARKEGTYPAARTALRTLCSDEVVIQYELECARITGEKFIKVPTKDRWRFAVVVPASDGTVTLWSANGLDSCDTEDEAKELVEGYRENDPHGSYGILLWKRGASMACN